MKGSMIDLFGIIVIIFIFGVSSLIAYTLMSAINDNSELFVANESIQIINNSVSTIKNFDYASVFIIFGLGVSVILSGFLIRTHPAFFIISIFMLIFVMIVSAQFTNAFMELGANSGLINAANEFTYTRLIFSNLPLIMLMIGIVLAIVMYSKMGGGDEY